MAKTVCPDRAALGQRERTAVVLAHIAARGSLYQLDPKLDPARDDGNLARFDLDDAELGCEAQLSLLRHEQHLAIGIVEILLDHGARDEIDMRAHSRLASGIARNRHGVHALDEREFLGWDWDGVPAHRRNRYVDFCRRSRAPEADAGLLEGVEVIDRRPNAGKPGSLVRCARGGKGRAAELLGVKAIAAFLRRVAADRQRARKRLGFEAFAESRHVADNEGALAGARRFFGEVRSVLNVHDQSHRTSYLKPSS